MRPPSTKRGQSSSLLYLQVVGGWLRHADAIEHGAENHEGTLARVLMVLDHGIIGGCPTVERLVTEVASHTITILLVANGREVETRLCQLCVSE